MNKSCNDLVEFQILFWLKRFAESQENCAEINVWKIQRTETAGQDFTNNNMRNLWLLIKI